MRVILERPPLFDLIDAAFHVAGKPVIFAWGRDIFNPEQITIPDQLIAHESIHGQRQGDDIEGWWRRYIVDPVFRLAEEIPAHQAEYWYLVEMRINRRERRGHMKLIAHRLAGPLYGGMISVGRAKALLQAGLA